MGLGSFDPTLGQINPTWQPQQSFGQQLNKGLGNISQQALTPQFQLAMQLLANSGWQRGNPSLGARVGNAGLGYAEQQYQQQNRQAALDQASSNRLLQAQIAVMEEKGRNTRADAELTQKAQEAADKDLYEGWDTSQVSKIGKLIGKGPNAGRTIQLTNADGSPITTDDEATAAMKTLRFKVAKTVELNPGTTASQAWNALTDLTGVQPTQQGGVFATNKLAGNATQLTPLVAPPGQGGLGNPQPPVPTPPAAAAPPQAAPAPVAQPQGLGATSQLPDYMTKPMTLWRAAEKGTGLKSGLAQIGNVVSGTLGGPIDTETTMARNALGSGFEQLVESYTTATGDRMSADQQNRLKENVFSEPKTSNPTATRQAELRQLDNDLALRAKRLGDQLASPGLSLTLQQDYRSRLSQIQQLREHIGVPSGTDRFGTPTRE